MSGNQEHAMAKEMERQSRQVAPRYSDPFGALRSSVPGRVNESLLHGQVGKDAAVVDSEVDHQTSTMGSWRP